MKTPVYTPYGWQVGLLIPENVLNDKRLTLNDKVLFSTLLEMVPEDDGFLRLSQEKGESILDRRNTSVLDSLKRLELYSYITLDYAYISRLVRRIKINRESLPAFPDN